MKVLLFGGTGLIGRAVTRAAVAAGHEVSAIARSNRGLEEIKSIGGEAVLGDMADPASWRDAVVAAEAVVQLAADFAGGLAAAEAIWTKAMVELARERKEGLRVIYTGGCWLFPAQTEPPLREGDAFDPLPPFRFMTDSRLQLLDSGVSVSTIHRGMVWSETGGCTSKIEEAIEQHAPIEVEGSTSVRWPLVHVDVKA